MTLRSASATTSSPSSSPGAESRPQLPPRASIRASSRRTRTTPAPAGLAWTPNSRTVVRAGYGSSTAAPLDHGGTAHSNNGINVIALRFTGNQVPSGRQAGRPPGSGASAHHLLLRPRLPEPRGAPGKHRRRPPARQRLRGGGQLPVRGRPQAPAHARLQHPGPGADRDPRAGRGSVTLQQFPLEKQFTNFTRILRFEGTGRSNYNGLTAEIRQRFGGASGLPRLHPRQGQRQQARRHRGRAGHGRREVRLEPVRPRCGLRAGRRDQRHRLVLRESGTSATGRTPPGSAGRSSTVGLFPRSPPSRAACPTRRRS